MILIGISGKKRSGKDTLATAIKVHTTLLIHKIAFADALKKEVAAALGITVQELERDKDFYRPILQWWGTDYRRKKFGEDYWTIQFAKAFLKSEADMVIAPDVRFPNEAGLIRQSGGILIRVEREGLPTDVHESETALDRYKFDYTFNNTTVDSCNQFARVLLSRIANQ